VVTALGLAGQLVVAEDATRALVADLESKLGDETTGAEAGCFFALGTHLASSAGEVFEDRNDGHG